MRLQKFLARSGVASRRGSENLMTQGRVSVNGKIVVELGSKVDPENDTVCIDGKQVSIADEAIYIILNKPAGYITTMSDPYGRKTVAQLLPTDEYPGLFPIGRLDADTTGLLLFSTDGDFGNRLLHPRYKIGKTYIATLDKPLNAEGKFSLEQGIMLDDGLAQPAVVLELEPYLIEITVFEGRKHQVKRMFKAVGTEVLELKRIKFGGIELGELPLGEYRDLSEKELEWLTGIL